ncbi:MAG: tryptophan-rich sensory protein [Ignavibacteria bacterium]|nr:tryptophan-rich sensory protein [Ignavibacteria bacterium]
MNTGRLLLSIALCQGIGIVAGWLTAQSVKTWYLTLAKPWFTPPGWVFGPAWILLYLLMGIALYLVWQKTGSLKTPAAIMFFVQLGLNGAWSLIFFGLRSPFWGLIEITFLLGAIAGTVVLFWRVTPAAGVLLVPYLLWVSFATVLNFSIWLMNR